MVKAVSDDVIFQNAHLSKDATLKVYSELTNLSDFSFGNSEVYTGFLTVF